MSDDHLARLQRVFEDALQHPEPERHSFVVQACDGDSALATEVLDLLAQDAAESGVLDRALVSMGPTPTQGRAETLTPGSFIDDYEVLEALGSGAFGAVYRARHKSIKKVVVLKILHAEHGRVAQLVRRFHDEARAVNEIGHPNIVDIFGFGETEAGQLYSVMEYIDAPSLQSRLAEGRRLTPERARPVLVGLAAALDAAHELGIVHRDLKPGNVLVRTLDDGSLSPTLLDFGIAKLSRPEPGPSDTKTGAMLGTPSYMAPEQIRGQAVDGRTDIYALGALAYRTLTGQLPFEAKSVFDTLLAHTQQPVPRPSAACPALGPTHDEALLAMLEKDPQDRPSRASEAIDRLYATPHRLDTRGGKTTRRAVLATAVVGTCAAAWLSTSSSEPGLAPADAAVEARPQATPEPPLESSPVEPTVVSPEPTAERAAEPTAPIVNPDLGSGPDRVQPRRPNRRRPPVHDDLETPF